MSIFVIGLSHTGIKSITKALDIIGYNVLQYAWDEEEKYKICRDGNYETSILEEYDGISDTVAAIYYPHFDEIYPGSKFIYTYRDKEGWCQAMSQYMRSRGRRNSEKYRLRTALYGTTVYSKLRMEYVFDRHRQEVDMYFKDRRGDVLYMNVFEGDGWKHLCSFLGKTEPEHKFPHLESARRD